MLGYPEVLELLVAIVNVARASSKNRRMRKPLESPMLTKFCTNRGEDCNGDSLHTIVAPGIANLGDFNFNDRASSLICSVQWSRKIELDDHLRRDMEFCISEADRGRPWCEWLMHVSRRWPATWDFVNVVLEIHSELGDNSQARCYDAEKSKGHLSLNSSASWSMIYRISMLYNMNALEHFPLHGRYL